MTAPALPAAALPPPTALAELYRQMWAHAAGARVRLLLALALLSSAQGLKLALPLMAAQAINAIQAQGRDGLQTAAMWIGAILGVNVLGWMLHGPARVLERGVALRVRRSIADLLFTRLVHAPLSWHDRHHSGDLQHRANQASGALFAFTQTQFIYLQNVIQCVGPLIALCWLSSLTGGLALLGFGLAGLAVLRFDRALMRLATGENQAERRYAARLLDFTGNIAALAGLRLQQAARERLDSRLLAVFAPLSRSIVLTEWKWCTVDLLGVGLTWGLVVTYALVTLEAAPAVGAAAAAGGTLMLGSLFMVHQYAQQSAAVLSSMAAHHQGLVHTRTDFASAELIRQAPQTAAPAPLPADWQRIAVHQLGFSYTARDLDEAADTPSSDEAAEAAAPRGGIEGVTLELRRGERIALVGLSGSGKSTLLRVLAGLYQAQSGALSIDGVPQPGLRHAAALATLVPQEAEIFEATLRENLCFDQDIPEPDIKRALHASALDEVLVQLPLGLQTPMSERGLNLSGGQRQRLALARGLLAARHSSLLLLDEPTSALDPLIEEHVQSRMAAAFVGQCIVASVHRLSLLPHFDRVGFMAGGRLIDIGTTDELRARQPAFAAMLVVTQAAAVR